MNRYVAKWLKIVIINVAIFCSFLTIIEITVRIVFTEIIPFGNSNNLFQDKRFGNSVGLTPNIKGYSFGAEVVTNGLGFRIDPASPDPRGKHHILVLGDSISFGPGIKAGDTFPFILQKRLKDCQIINASVPGYSTGDYFNVLSFIINSKLPFEGVIISICLNDFSDASQALIKQQLEKNRDIIYHNAFLQLLKYVSDNYIDFNSILRERSRTYFLIKNLATDTAKNYFLADLSTYDNANMEEIISHRLKRIHDLAVINGKWILFVICPYEYQLRQSSNSNHISIKPQKMIMEVARKAKLPIIDLLPLFKNHLAKTKQKATFLFIFGDPMHFSLTGHQVAAQCILDELGKRRLN